MEANGKRYQQLETQNADLFTALVGLRDITRVVVANQYGSPSFQEETARRNTQADIAIAKVEELA